MNRDWVAVTVIAAITAAVAGWLLIAPSAMDHADHAHHDHAHEGHGQEMARGPHGGRLLAQNGFELEVVIFEHGVRPEMRVYAYHDERPVSPDEIALIITLERTGGRIDQIRFAPQEDYLRGKTVIGEPHSFVVDASAAYAGRQYAWRYENFEGRTRIPGAVAAETGIRSEPAGPVNLTETLALTGRVQTDPNRLSRVRPRFAGVVKAIRRELGDTVEAGALLATVQSNESLQDYEVRAPISGLIVKRDIQVGEATGVEPLFVIADLSAVWVELDVFIRDLERVSPGQAVVVETLDGSYSRAARIDWVSPLAAHASQSVRARLSLDNQDGAFRPGQFIRGHVTVAERPVPVAVRRSALQLFRGGPVVFARFDDIYEVRMLELGRQNSEWAEVLSGIEPGTEYVTGNSYLVKADIEKSGASHDH